MDFEPISRNLQRTNLLYSIEIPFYFLFPNLQNKLCTYLIETPPASVTLDGKNMLCVLSIPVKPRPKFVVVYFKPTSCRIVAHLMLSMKKSTMQIRSNAYTKASDIRSLIWRNSCNTSNLFWRLHGKYLRKWASWTVLLPYTLTQTYKFEAKTN